MRLPHIIEIISSELIRHHAKAIVVGGSVRDHFLGLPIKDYDIEVYGLDSMDDLEQILSIFGSVNLVGKSFGILKLMYGGDEYDFSLPRAEQKSGVGHRGFDIVIDGKMSFEQASRRRDFTINAMGYDIEKKILLDPYDGQSDLDLKILRHVDKNTFKEDPLRVYRAVQFVARFGLEISQETLFLCKQMTKSGELDELPKERVCAEFRKLLLKSPKPSIGFELMREVGVLRYFPELQDIINVPQSPVWHPEGDVWVHTMMALDSMAKELDVSDEKYRLRMMFAILCHDLGKATTTTVEADGRIRSIGHEYAGVELTKSFLYRLTDEHGFIESILPLVEHHLKPSQFYKDRSGDRAIRRLATKVNIPELITVAQADFLGRETEESLAGAYRAGLWLSRKAQELDVYMQPLENLLRGKDLIDMGLEPSPIFSKVLNSVYEMMLDGKITTTEEALKYVKENFI